MIHEAAPGDIDYLSEGNLCNTAGEQTMDLSGCTSLLSY